MPQLEVLETFNPLKATWTFTQYQCCATKGDELYKQKKYAKYMSEPCSVTTAWLIFFSGKHLFTEKPFFSHPQSIQIQFIKLLQLQKTVFPRGKSYYPL